jgi:hypothetical protein
MSEQIFCRYCHLPVEDCECLENELDIDRDENQDDHADWLIDPDMGDQ